MEITDVRVFPVDEEKLKAFVSIIIDDCFVVSDIKVISGTSGLFISMPSKRRKNGTFRDIAHPLNSETRKRIEDKVLARYREAVASKDQAAGPAPAGGGAPEGPRGDEGGPDPVPDGQTEG
jgi:stage V sporulation protein G